jgi:hypothetical protein
MEWAKTVILAPLQPPQIQREKYDQDTNGEIEKDRSMKDRKRPRKPRATGRWLVHCVPAVAVEAFLFQGISLSFNARSGRKWILSPLSKETRNVRRITAQE